VTAQYDSGPVHAFGVYGYSVIDYSFVDHFRRAAPGSAEEYSLNPDSTDGHQIKGGLSYDLAENFSVYGNAGWVSKTPIFDGVVNDIVGQLVNGSENEKFTSFETGVRWTNNDGKFTANAGLYFTTWKDRTVSVTNENADTITYLRGVNSEHNGFEIEADYRPIPLLRFQVAASYGEWKYTDDVQGEVFEISTGEQVPGSSNYYIKNVSVGDAPQTQVVLSGTVYPVDGLSIKLQGRWYDRYYSDFTPESRTGVGDYADSWEIPDYVVFDLHVNYNIPTFTERFDVSLFAHVFNLTDEIYISDATDESSFEAVGTALAPRHSAQRAEVFFGAPLTVNAGVTLRF
jgi:outer membrane receptor for Fe3+-dicitrate